MQQAVLDILSRWTNFYLIVGTSAGALTGLQFVVIALGHQMRATGSRHDVRAFGSPTVVNFCAVLFISAVVTAPWHSLTLAGQTLALGGALGIIYIFNSIRHARKPTAYTPDASDWGWYVGLPLVTYMALLMAGILLPRNPNGALAGVAGIALILLFTGIRNAWDTVTYLVVEKTKSSDKKGGTV